MLKETVIFVRFKEKDEKTGQEVEQVMKQDQYMTKYPEPAEGEEDKFELQHTTAEVQVGETRYADTLAEALELFGHNEKEVVNQLNNAAGIKQENYFRSKLASKGERSERFTISDKVFPAYETLPQESQRKRLTDEEKLKKLFPGASAEMLAQAATMLKNLQPQEVGA